MSYTVKAVFMTLQGEGANTGRPAVFCRFSGCNLACSWCDTDFAGGRVYETARELAAEIASHWPGSGTPFVVFTGGEPLLQLDAELIQEVRRAQFEIAVETNGTVPVPRGVDWVTVSPKAGAPLVVTSGDELKLVFPQTGAEPERYEGMAFRHLFLSPMAGQPREHTIETIQYCLEHPQWRLSVQMHKRFGVR